MTTPNAIFLELEIAGQAQRTTIELAKLQEFSVNFSNASLHVVPSFAGERLCVRVEVLEGSGDLYAALGFHLEPWSTANYLLMPAAVYGGNRVSIVTPDGQYPPFLPADYVELTPPQLTGVIQHLDPMGGGSLQETAAEGAFPAVGLFDATAGEAFWLLTAQANEAGNYGYTIDEAPGATALDIRLASPVHRRFCQHGCNSLGPADDPPMPARPGTVITFEILLHNATCPTLRDFFRQARELRNEMVPRGRHPALLPYSEATRLVRDRLEADNWFEEFGYYSTITKTDLAGICRNSSHHWQLGWVGGILKTEYLLREGDPEYRKRIEREWNTLFDYAQQPSGFFCTTAFNGRFFPDWPPKTPHDEPAPGALVRKNADALAHLAKQFLVLKAQGTQIQEDWLKGFQKCADAFVKLWLKFGQLGYFLTTATGDLLIGGGAGGAAACTGLALATELLGKPGYLSLARNVARQYVAHYLDRGNVYGGVGDALQATDSESAYALLEALVTLWECTGEDELLEDACFAADYLSTWMVSYDYRFPSQSTFGKMDMRTTGTVYANIQNRHSAPGFCSASGDALFKLYRATGRVEYARLAQDVVRALPQYLSHPGRPIPGMEVVGMSERVNLGDWETRAQVGKIGNAPCACWPEVALLLARVHIPGVYARTDTREILCFDHLEAAWTTDGALRIANPTDYPAVATLLLEDAAAARIPLKVTAYERFRKVAIPPHAEVIA